MDLIIQNCELDEKLRIIVYYEICGNPYISSLYSTILFIKISN